MKRNAIIGIVLTMGYLSASEMKVARPELLSIEVVGQRAHFMLGKMLLRGEGGQKDPEKARVHFEKAASQPCDEVGTAWACIELAKIYALQLGVFGDHERMMALVEKASAIAQKLTPQKVRHEVCASVDQILKIAEIIKKPNDVHKKDEHGRTPLHWACEQGAPEIVELLLAFGAQLDARNKRQETPLHLACFQGHNDLVEILLAHGADIEATSEIDDGGGWSPLLWACNGGRVEVVDVLLAHRANVKAAADDGWSPLHAAADKGGCQIVKKLITAGADIAATKKGGCWIPLHTAAEKGYAAIVEVLVTEAKRAGVIDYVNTLDRRGFTPVYLASENNREEVVDVLIAHKGKVNLAADDGWSPLHVAADKGGCQIVKKLVTAGADIAATKKGGCWIPLHAAAEKGHADIIEVLVTEARKSGVIDYVNTFDHQGFTPLHWAAKNMHKEVARTLLAMGADALRKSSCGSLPIHEASLSGHFDVVSILIPEGNENLSRDQMNAYDAGNLTPLHWASRNGHVRLVSLLLSRGADPRRCENGWSCMHEAAMNGDCEVIKMLLRHGISVNCTNSDNWTPLHAAVHKGNLSAVELLILSGADVNACSKGKWTPLHEAAKCNRLNVVGLLLDHRANKNAQSHDGSTPLRVAQQNKHYGIVALLQ